MPKNLVTALRSRLAAQDITAGVLVSIATESGTQRYTSLPFDIDVGGNTYSSSVDLLGTGEIEENSELFIATTTIGLAATASNISLFAQSSIINKTVEIQFVYLNPTNNTVIGDAVTLFKGQVTGYSMTERPTSASIALSVSSVFANFDKNNGRRTNPGSFKREHPSDDSMEFSYAKYGDIPWGKKI